jgi:cobalt-zinc-cadmium efflux system membrane fusion protein
MDRSEHPTLSPETIVKKKDLLAALGGLVLLAVGFGGVVVAERQGWLGEGAKPALEACPHTLTPETCPFCTPARVEQLGPCREHGVPEALCSRCNASLIPAFKAKNDWCGGHSVPESQCVICDPSRAPASDATTPPPPGTVSLVPAGEDLPRTARAPSTKCATETLRVQFLSAEVARDAGLAYATVAETPVPLALKCTAEVEHDKNRYAHVAPRAPGFLRSVARDLGDRVQAGDALAVVASTQLSNAKADLLRAHTLVALWERNNAREQRLLARKISTVRDALQAETELAKSRVSAARAKQRLRNLGLADAEIARVTSSQDTSADLALTAPIAGTVVARDAVVGEIVDTDGALFAIADTRKVWAMLDVQEADVRRVQVGQPIVLSVAALRGETFPGRVTWISAELNRRTRTLKARAEVANPLGVLRAGMFGRAAVQVSGPEARVLVPKNAVQWEGCCNVVFVRKNDRLFEPRKVRLGPDAGERWVVEAGLSAGETVVTTGSFLLKTEIKKGSIGAGCCEVEPSR